MKRLMLALVMVMLSGAGILKADTVQWQSTPEEKISYEYKVGFYVRTMSESPLVIDLVDPTVYDTHLDQLKFTGDDLKVVFSNSTITSTPAAKSASVKTADGQIKGSAGVVYALNVSGVGVTIGDKVEIKNSTDNGGTSLITVVADAANGTWSFYPSVGITYGTGIYSDETKSGGTFTVTVVYE